jgi:hypothetical protein
MCAICAKYNIANIQSLLISYILFRSKSERVSPSAEHRVWSHAYRITVLGRNVFTDRWHFDLFCCQILGQFGHQSCTVYQIAVHQYILLVHSLHHHPLDNHSPIFNI